MSLVINTNVAATEAAINLNKSNSNLQQSLQRLSSGSKLTNSASDPGGLAVSMKLNAAINNTQDVQSNIADAVSLLQTQDGALSTVGNILTRMSELSTLYTDVTKSTSDKANYQTEFSQLQGQLSNISGEAFNGVSLFGTAATGAGGTLSVSTSEDGTQSVSINKSYLNGSTAYKALLNTSNTLSSGASLAGITSAIQDIATFRATNGASTSRLNFASDMLTANLSNLQAANSQISDVDVASESTNYAKYQILVQSGASMLAQANSSAQIALKLISG
jgi:flagellin